ncbi:MAG: hypothetical protein ABL888_02520, partial [Pirellulaceae bacterium]
MRYESLEGRQMLAGDFLVNANLDGNLEQTVLADTGPHCLPTGDTEPAVNVHGELETAGGECIDCSGHPEDSQVPVGENDCTGGTHAYPDSGVIPGVSLPNIGESETVQNELLADQLLSAMISSFSANRLLSQFWTMGNVAVQHLPVAPVLHQFDAATLPMNSVADDWFTAPTPAESGQTFVDSKSSFDPDLHLLESLKPISLSTPRETDLTTSRTRLDLEVTRNEYFTAAYSGHSPQPVQQLASSTVRTGIIDQYQAFSLMDVVALVATSEQVSLSDARTASNMRQETAEATMVVDLQSANLHQGVAIAMSDKTNNANGRMLDTEIVESDSMKSLGRMNLTTTLVSIVAGSVLGGNC